MFQGQNLLTMTEKQLDQVRGKEIAMIFQDITYSLNPVFTIGNQMMEPLRRHEGMSRAEAWKRAVALLDKTGIPHPENAMHKYPHMLSGGMRQRVMIAMALACKPKLLIADEPTTALDVTIQLQIMQLLRHLRDETGMAILLITHDIGLVTEMADRVVVMYAGQCVEEGTTQQVLESPAHPYTRALTRAVPRLHDPRERRLYSILRHGAGGISSHDRLPFCAALSEKQPIVRRQTQSGRSLLVMWCAAALRRKEG